MNYCTTLLARLAIIIASPFIPLTLAQAATECVWFNGLVGPINYTVDIGTHFVPRDVPRGTAIGPIFKRYGPYNGGGRSIWCSNSTGLRLDLRIRNRVPLVPGIFTPIAGEDITGKVLSTNVPGIGAVIRPSPIYDDLRGWIPTAGSNLVPFEAYSDWFLITPMQHSFMWPYITLVKTGDIAPGVHTISVPDMFGGEFTTIGLGFTTGLTGTVIQAECSVSSTPVSAYPVDLGTWQLSDFTGVGYSTTPEPFTITLNACRTDDRTPPQTITYAHVRLDPTAGSRVHDAAAGLFTLGTGSTAKGVVMQILHDDGTPIPLTTEVRLKAITSGTTILDFQARLYQSDPSALVEAGSATGSLSFTISYL